MNSNGWQQKHAADCTQSFLWPGIESNDRQEDKTNVATPYFRRRYFYANENILMKSIMDIIEYTFHLACQYHQNLTEWTFEYPQVIQ